MTMPEIGDIRQHPTSHTRQGFLACPDCGQGRWVTIVRGQPISARCRVCANRQKNVGFQRGWKNPNYNGHRFEDSSGYIKVRIRPDDPYFSMADARGYVLEHRYVMAQQLGRVLTKDDIVHHRDGVRSNNDPENLEVLTQKQHRDEHERVMKMLRAYEERIRELEARVEELEREHVKREVGGGGEED